MDIFGTYAPWREFLCILCQIDAPFSVTKNITVIDDSLCIFLGISNSQMIYLYNIGFWFSEDSLYCRL